MRKLYALAAVAMFALTLTLGTVGCAPKTEESSTTTTETTPPPAETPAAVDTAATDTTSHM
ncbi:MAG: hypothetical protein ACREOU_00935 [Candidatus Eiseniibacteriota bacterium]